MKTHARGFTLIELMLAGALLAFVAVAVGMVMVNQQRLFHDNQATSQMNENLRMASDALTASLRNAGFGVDPNLAFDFQYFNCANESGIGKTAACTAIQRNNTGNGSDEIVMYGRDPYYNVSLVAGGPISGHAWKVSSATASSVSLTGEAYTFRKGQILQLVCPGGSTYAYVTVGTQTVLTANVSGNVSLDTGGPPTSPWYQQSALAANACLKTSAIAYLVNRSRYFIGPFSGHPYLMLDRGIDLNGDGNIDASDLTPIAGDIEDLQVAYEMAQATGTAHLDNAGNDDSVLYDDPSEKAMAAPKDAALNPPCPDVSVPFYAQRCFYERVSGDPARLQNYVANIAGVKIGLVARVPAPDKRLRDAKQWGTIPSLFDRPALSVTTAVAGTSLNLSCPPLDPSCYGYKRVVGQFGVSTPNLQSRGLFLW